MKLAFSLSAIAGANVLLAFLTQWYILVALGPGRETDALFAGMVVPQLVLSVISGSLMHVLVPLLANEDEERLRRDAWTFFFLIGAAFSILAFILYVLAPLWVPLLVPGFSAAGKALTITLTRIQLIGMVAAALTGVLWATHHARRHFIWAELSSPIGAAVGFGLLVLTLAKYGVVAAAYVSALNTILQMLLLLPGLGPYHKVDWNSPSTREAWHRIKPLLMGTAYYKTDPLVDRFLSSMAPPGGLSLFYLGQQMYGAAGQIINKAIAAPMVPLLASHAKAGQWLKFRHVYRKRLLWVTCLTGAGYLILLVMGEQILKLLIGHGGVTGQNVVLLWRIMVGLVGVFVAGGQITSAAFYAKGDTKTPTRFGIWTYTIYAPAKIGAFLYAGLMGLAVSTSMFYIVNMALQFYALEGILAKLVLSKGESIHGEASHADQ